MSKNLNLIKVAKELSLSNDEVSLDLSGDLSVSGSTSTVTLVNTSLGDTVLMPDNSNNISTAPGIRFEADTDTGIGLASAGNLTIVTGGSERLRVDSSGNVLVGAASNSPTTTAGINLGSNNKLHSTRDGGVSGYFNRLTSDGDTIEFAKDGVTTGNIGNFASSIYIVGSVGKGFLLNNNLVPAGSGGAQEDNTMDLGQGNRRWNDAYVYNGVTSGSDGRQKQDIEELSESEQRVAIACKGLLRKFRWKDMVAEKGDDARIHFGIIAQDLKAAFEAEGLDAGRYGMFIHSEWWETEEAYTDEDGVTHIRTNTYDSVDEAPEGAVKKDRMGIRYSELLAFIIAAI